MIGEVIYLFIATLALMLRRVENFISEQFSKAKRTASVHGSDQGVSDTTVDTRKSQTMAELLNRRKKNSEKSKVHSKEVVKLMQKSKKNNDTAKQELPNPAKLEQDTSKITHNDTSDMFVKYKNKKVQLRPPPKTSVENTSDTAKVTVNLPPLKEQKRGEKVVKNNSNPKQKRRLLDILRNWTRKIKCHKSKEKVYIYIYINIFF